MKYISNGKVIIIHLIVRFIKEILLYEMSYFPHCDQSRSER